MYWLSGFIVVLDQFLCIIIALMYWGRCWEDYTGSQGVCCTCWETWTESARVLHRGGQKSPRAVKRAWFEDWLWCCVFGWQQSTPGTAGKVK